MTKTKTPPQRAHTVSATHCRCGTVYICLHRRDGSVFAAAALPIADAMDFADVFGGLCEAALAGRVADGGECLH